jgi:hypothetical protein
MPDITGLVRVVDAVAAAGIITLGWAWHRRRSERRVQVPMDDAVQLSGAELTLASSAAAAVDAISQSSAWQSDQLADHRARLDLDDELDQIVSTCARLEGLQRTIDAGGRSGLREPDVVQNARGSLDEVRAMLQQRVEALTTYRTQLQQLEVRQAELDRLTRIESAADELTDLVAGTAHDEQAIANLRGLSAEATAAAEAVHDAMTTLDAGLDQLDTPLRTTSEGDRA